jgi:hypothetical protein
LETIANYPFRMFGIRTVVLGADLLLLKGTLLRRAQAEAILIHGSDTVCAAVGGIRHDVPPRVARLTTAISSVSLLLAVVAYLLSRPEDETTAVPTGADKQLR